MAGLLLAGIVEAPVKQARFEDLFLEELEDLYDAEKQIVAALPKMIAAASSEELAAAFQEHLDETREQLVRLEKIFADMGEEPRARESLGALGLIRAGERLIEDMQKSRVLDVGLIGAAQKIEHYEIAAYGTARSMAEMLGQLKVAETLLETLDEESAADQALTEIAESIINAGAMAEEEVHEGA